MTKLTKNRNSVFDPLPLPAPPPAQFSAAGPPRPPPQSKPPASHRASVMSAATGMTRAREPDLLVGVDFGMTCTGVSYANLNRSKNVRTIQNWPGRMQANENKVPTILSYSRSARMLSKWGFEAESQVERDNPDREPVDWFKVLLDEQRFKLMKDRDPLHQLPATQDEVEKYFVDYLSSLYKHIEYKLSPELPMGKTWSTALIEFIFSVPTTWQPQPTVERFRAIAARAGFSQFRTHSLAIGLTEAEAAAVHTSLEAPGLFKEGDILLVCDIGGGTTDLSVLRVKSASEDLSATIQLEQMDVVQGQTIGSAKIDEAFEQLALQRLQLANLTYPLPAVASDVAWKMMKSREFQNAKCDFGSPDDAPIFAVPTVGLDTTYRNDPVNMAHGVMQFARADMQDLFDKQIVGLYEMIDRQVTRFRAAHPNNAITHLILSGGLGNSAYVQDRLKAKYSFKSGSTANLLSADAIQVYVAPEPQLAVCKGIIADRISVLRGGPGVLPWRCARASYGMICKVKYNPNDQLQRGLTTTADPYTGELFITSTVEWFIKKGQPVNSSTPIIRPFTRKFPPGGGREFRSSIIISHEDANSLPFQLGEKAKVVAEITSDLSRIPEQNFKLKNRHWWNSGKQYRRCEYDVRVIVGAADVLFELWYKGQKLSEDNPMPVAWHDVAGPPLGVTRRYDDVPELPAMSKSRKVGSIMNLYGTAGISPVSQTRVSPAASNSRVSPVAPPATIYEIGQGNLGHPGALSQAYPQSPGAAFRHEMPSVGSPVPSTPLAAGYWQPQQQPQQQQQQQQQPLGYPQGPVQYHQQQQVQQVQVPVQYQHQQVPAGYPAAPVQYQQVPVSYRQVPVTSQQQPQPPTTTQQQAPVQVHELPTGIDTGQDRPLQRRDPSSFSSQPGGTAP